jgi:MoxR-like ATPase
MTTLTLQNLSTRQRQFVEALASTFPNAQGGDKYSRQDLIEVCESTGIYACPPSWITQNSDRIISRGFYTVPEALEVNISAVEPVQASKAAPSMPQGKKVQTVSTVPSVDLAASVLGMTGGDRATLVPSRMSTYVPWGHFSSIEKILKANIFYPCFITGLSGNGKTTMIEQVCAKLKRECFRVNITKQTDEDDLLGGFRLIKGETVWSDGAVVKAMRQGGVLLLDEIDLASFNIMCLQPVLEGKGVYLKKINEWVHPAPGFTIFATANTKGKGSDDGRFIGTNVLNEAFLDRFPVTFEQEYAPRATEKKILKKAMTAVGVDDNEFAEHLTTWAAIIRKSFAEGAIDEIVSTRRLVDITKAYSIFGDKMVALNMAISRFDDDTKEGFLNLYTKVDADAGVAAINEGETAPVNFSEASRIDLSVKFDDKDAVRSRGAKWDKAAKKWHITGEQFAQDGEFWSGYAPLVRQTWREASDDTKCPF